MRVAVTGTPGTGKTAATERLDSEGDLDLDVIHLNEVIREEDLTAGHDADRDSAIADLEAVADHLAGRENVVIESHLAHRLDVDRVVVLRCHPEELARRLRDRGEPPDTVEENAESEALDLVLSEAVAEHGADSVYEVPTTGASVAETAAAIEAVIRGEREPSAGTVSFVDYLDT